MRYPRDADVPAPDALALVARYILGRRVGREMARLARNGDPSSGAARIGEILTEARSLGIALTLDPRRTARHLEAALLAAITHLEATLDPVAVATAPTGVRLGEGPGGGAPRPRAAPKRGVPLRPAVPPGEPGA